MPLTETFDILIQARASILIWSISQNLLRLAVKTLVVF